MRLEMVMNFLKDKDKEIEESDDSEIVHLHELDENEEFTTKMNRIIENEEDFEIYDSANYTVLDDYDCDFCEYKVRKEMKLLVHLWT